MAERLPLLLSGPTASGKSAAALQLAKSLDGEIISVDSMQVYRGMDIGTAKARPEDRACIPHHLIDILELNQSFDAAQFVAQAETALADILKRGRLPILCGGTGLYFQALLNGLGVAPRSDFKLRETLESLPLEALLTELKVTDFKTYEKIDTHNRRRVVRAVEVVRLTGRSFSDQRSSWDGHNAIQPPGRRLWPFFCLERGKDDLNRRISNRVEEMFANGLVEETEALLEKGLADNPTALQALGYRQVYDYLRGRRTLEETVDFVKQKTRQYAKRQMTWFRHQGHVEWIGVSDTEPMNEIVERLRSRYAERCPR